MENIYYQISKKDVLKTAIEMNIKIPKERENDLMMWIRFNIPEFFIKPYYDMMKEGIKKFSKMKNQGK